MITINRLTWSNWFSYGEENELDFTDAKVTQITGKNGSGKSSIPVILGEVLYGKNAFGKTKQKLFNRYIDKPVLKAKIEFEKDGKTYIVDYSRKTTLKLVLIEDGIDISSHSSSNTVKTLNDILGFDFKLFWQLVYQSSTIGLEFLTATDTNRKKFLINLFNLDKYLSVHDQFKKINSTLSNELLVLKTKASTTESWINTNEKEDLTIKDLEEVPSIDSELVNNLAELKSQLANINETNKKINTNNAFKNILKDLDTSILNESLTEPSKENFTSLSIQKQKDIEHNKKQINVHNNKIARINGLQNQCPSCFQDITEQFKQELILEDVKKVEELNALIEKETKELVELKSNIKINKILQEKKTKKEKVASELQELLSKIDQNLSNEILDEVAIKNEISEISKIIANITSAIQVITSQNLKNEAHNAKVRVIIEQLDNYKNELKNLTESIDEKEFTINKINVIKKAFSTNGLVSYKIEFLVKDLEHQINTYLEELSNGRFQLLFALNGEKLDIDIIDDGKTIGIEELSAGELARINTSTLLAIRKLMAAISSTKLNILFLDEIMGVLDEEGKEKLIDILNSETELNTYLVSHEFTHPLIPKINIIKENKISRIDYG